MNPNQTDNEEKIGDKLTLKQELFCQTYVKNEELMGNGVLAYDLAYGFNLKDKNTTRLKNERGEEIKGTSEYDKVYNTCAVNASRLLINAKIQDRNTELWNEMLIDMKIDAKLARLIYKAKDETSLLAIKEYNKLKQRITDKSEITGKDGKDLIPSIINITNPN